MAEKRKAPPTSPYKALKKRNATYCGYVSVSALTPDRAYKITNLERTYHEKFGQGELSFLEGKNKSKCRCQLPSKYLRTLTEEMIQVFYDDIAATKYPFLIFRKVMPDNSFEIDILPFSDEMNNHHIQWTDVPELEASLTASEKSTKDDETKENVEDDKGSL